MPSPIEKLDSLCYYVYKQSLLCGQDFMVKGKNYEIKENFYRAHGGFAGNKRGAHACLSIKLFGKRRRTYAYLFRFMVVRLTESLACCHL